MIYLVVSQNNKKHIIQLNMKIDNQFIIENLKKLRDNLNNNSTYSEYTANEARRDATTAISLLRKFKVEKSNIVIQEYIVSTISELEKAIEKADYFYDNYDFVKRKYKYSSYDAFICVNTAKNAIELFIHFVKENDV